MRFKILIAGGHSVTIATAQETPLTAAQYWAYLRTSADAEGMIALNEQSAILVKAVIGVVDASIITQE